MRDIYFVNNFEQFNGDHEVHTENCIKMPADRTYLGEFSTPKAAISAAKKIFRQSNGCYHCCPEAHSVLND